MVEDCEHDLQRRIMLAKLGLGAAAIGLAAGGAVPARAQGGAAGRFQPALHMQDEWMDRIGGSHRMVFDATTPAAAGAALNVAFAEHFNTVARHHFVLRRLERERGAAAVQTAYARALEQHRRKKLQTP